VSEETEQNEIGVPKLILFVTGDAPRSRRARENLTRALKAIGLSDLQPMEVDLLSEPQETITYSVFATPALLRTNDRGEVSVLYGDLADAPKLRDFVRDLSG